jgi:hypothetical protein
MTKKDLKDTVEIPSSKRQKGEKQRAATVEESDTDTVNDFLDRETREDREDTREDRARIEDREDTRVYEDTREDTRVYEDREDTREDRETRAHSETHEETENDDMESVSTKYSVAIEARKRSTGKVTPLEFKDILNGCIQNVLDTVFGIKDTIYTDKDTIIRILQSNLYWSNIFSKINQVISAEQLNRTDDKLVLYIRDSSSSKKIKS